MKMDSDLVQTCIDLMSTKFTQLESIEQKIRYVLSEKELFQKVCIDFFDTLEDYHQNHRKSLLKGKQYLNEGNTYYTQNALELAIDSYSMGIMNIAIPSESGTNELSLAHSLRSNAFYKMRNFSSALFDANCALDLLPTLGMNLRKIHCFIHLDRYSEAKQLISDIMNNHSNDGENQSLLKHLKELKERICDQSFDEMNSKIEVKNKVISNLYINESIGLFNSESKGRGYVAKQDIGSKTVVISESAFVVTQTELSLKTHCNQCFVKVNNQFIACKTCNEVVFCSQQCLDTAMVGSHSNECTITGLLRRFGSYSNLVYKIICKVGVKTAIDLYNGNNCEHIEENEEKSAFIEKYKLFSMFNHHSQHRDHIMETFDVIIAIKLCLSLNYMKVNEFDAIKEREQFVRLCLVVVNDIRRVLINYFGIFDTNTSSDQQKRTGDLIALNGTLFNHSCVPNVKWVFENQKINFIAFRDISAGEELTITYGPMYTVTPLIERQNKLKTNYYFVCNCFGCIEESKYVSALQCLQCNVGPVLCDGITEETNERLCLNCGQRYDNIRDAINKMQTIIAKVENLLTEMEKSLKTDESFDAVIESMESLSKMIYSKSNQLICFKKRLSRFCCSVEKFKIALNYSNEILKSIENTDSFEYCCEVSFYSRVYYEFLKHTKVIDNNEWKICLDMNEKICEFLKNYRNNVLNKEQTLSLVLMNSMIALKESIITRMKNVFLKSDSMNANN